MKTSKQMSLKGIAKVSTFCLLVSAFSVSPMIVNASDAPEINVVYQNKKVTGTVVDITVILLLVQMSLSKERRSVILPM